MSMEHGRWPLALVEWVDSIGCSTDWVEIPEPEEMAPTEPLICKSVGWLVKDNKHYFVLVPHLSPPHEGAEKEQWDGCGDMAIPKQSVVRVTLFTEEYLKRDGNQPHEVQTR